VASGEWREWGETVKSKMEIGRLKSAIRGAWPVFCGLCPATGGMEGGALAAETQGSPFAADAQGEPFVKATQGKLVRDGHGEG
jgi:hypothetical protein